MNITQNKEETKLTIALEGRLDTTTAPSLEEVTSSALVDVKELIFDFSQLEYISSAGLRVILAAQKTMNKQGEMKVVKANENIKEIFDITGFSDIITLED